ncbi:MAG: hypothetical protein D6743_07285, partial [Calditrichaeota bacterium]
MKLFHKQLAGLSIFFALVFGLATYFAFGGLHRILRNQTERTAYLLALRFRAQLQQEAGGDGVHHDLKKLEKRARELLLTGKPSFDAVENFAVVGAEGKSIFSLVSTPGGSPENPLNDDSLAVRQEAGIM